LLRRWNWKAALFSSTLRAILFLLANLSAGWRAATGAMAAEFLYRAVTAGFYGAITQAFRKAEPAWAAAISTVALVPLVSHALELTLHLARGTPKIITSLIASVVFTVVSTLFNWYAMRRGALVVGEDTGSIVDDLKQLPRLICEAVSAGPRSMYRWAARTLQAGVDPALGKALRSGRRTVERRQYS
jgi:hypothetical protein